MFYLGNKEKVTSNLVICNDRTSILSLQKDIRGSGDKFRISNLVISECVLPRNNMKKSILNFDFFDEMQFDILNKILDSDFSKEEIKYLINHLSCYEDFILFADRVIPTVEFKELYSYDVMKLREFDELSKSLNLSSESSVILQNYSHSIQNSKVLELVKKYKEI